jgi:hypothetical protein
LRTVPHRPDLTVSSYVYFDNPDSVYLHALRRQKSSAPYLCPCPPQSFTASPYIFSGGASQLLSENPYLFPGGPPQLFSENPQVFPGGPPHLFSETPQVFIIPYLFADNQVIKPLCFTVTVYRNTIPQQYCNRDSGNQDLFTGSQNICTENQNQFTGSYQQDALCFFAADVLLENQDLFAGSQGIHTEKQNQFIGGHQQDALCYFAADVLIENQGLFTGQDIHPDRLDLFTGSQKIHTDKQNQFTGGHQQDATCFFAADEKVYPCPGTKVCAQL